MEIRELAEVYLRYFQSKRQQDQWSVKEVDTLVGQSPEAGWELTKALVGQSRSDAELAYIAAGPLEDLLRKHGPALIDTIANQAQNNERLQLALSGAWLEPQDAIYARWYSLMSDYGFADGRREAL